MTVGRLTLLIAVLFLLFGVSSSTLAQNGTAGITVTPVRDEFTIARGATIQRELRVINPINKTVTLYPRVLDFYTDNDQGQPKFFNPGDKSNSYALSDWVSFSSNSLEIAPNQEVGFDVTVTAPTDAEPGGHYGAVLFSTEQPNLTSDGSQIGVVGLVGTLLLATVPGGVVEKNAITTFKLPKIALGSPVKITTTIHNQGNVHSKPAGQINIRRSGQSVSTLKVNQGENNILPQSYRTFENNWIFDWKTMGTHTVRAALIYGTPEQQLIAQSKILVIPLWLIIAIIGALVLIITYLVRRAKRKQKIEQLINQIPQKPRKPILR